MIDRRRFIRYSLIGAGAGTVVLAGGTLGYKITHFEKSVVAILAEDLTGLKVSASDIQLYAHEISHNNTLGYSFATIKLICLYPKQPYKWLSFPFKNKYRQRRAELVGYFLLSSNFFFNKMDEKQEINYSGYVYDPYKNSCSNPFSGSYYKS